jgi:hypothetical protein
MIAFDLMFRSEGPIPLRVRVHGAPNPEAAMLMALPQVQLQTKSQFANCYAYRMVKEDGIDPWAYLTLNGIRGDPEEEQEP